MSQVKMRLVGGKELQQALGDAGPKIRDRVMGPALRAGARPIVAMARSLCPVRTGQLKKSLGAVLRTTKRGRSSGAVKDKYVVLGARSGFAVQSAEGTNNGVDPTKYSHLAERGHGPGKSGKGSSADPHHFLKPAFEAKASEAHANIIAEVRARVDIELSIKK